MIRSASRLPNTGASPASAEANSHCPLRLTQSLRISCGRGYSGSGLFLSTRSPQGVVRRWVDAFAAERITSGTVSEPTTRPPSPE